MSFPGDKGLPSKTLIEGTKIVRKAKIIPNNVIDKPLMVKGSSSSLSKSLETSLREEKSLNLLSTKCFDVVFLKSTYLLKVEYLT